MSQRMVVDAEWLNVRGEANRDGLIVTVLPKGSIVESLETHDDGVHTPWHKVAFSYGGIDGSGWASGKFLHPLVETTPSELCNAYFNEMKRQEYVHSILAEKDDGEPSDKFNFLRQGFQVWNDGNWLHGYGDGEKFYCVGVNWDTSQNKGILEISKPTEEISESRFRALFPNTTRATYCNFNVAYCYKAYGGMYLQDSNGTAPGGQRNATQMR